MIDTLDRTIKIKNGILGNCPNYDKIANFDIARKDNISEDLKNKYVDFITANILKEDELQNIFNIDKIMAEYIKKSKFYKLVQKTYNMPVYDKDGSEMVFDCFELMDYLYNQYVEKKIITPKKGRWL